MFLDSKACLTRAIMLFPPYGSVRRVESIVSIPSITKKSVVPAPMSTTRVLEDNKCL